VTETEVQRLLVEIQTTHLSYWEHWQIKLVWLGMQIRC